MIEETYVLSGGTASRAQYLRLALLSTSANDAIAAVHPISELTHLGILQPILVLVDNRK